MIYLTALDCAADELKVQAMQERRKQMSKGPFTPTASQFPGPRLGDAGCPTLNYLQGWAARYTARLFAQIKALTNYQTSCIHENPSLQTHPRLYPPPNHSLHKIKQSKLGDHMPYSNKIPRLPNSQRPKSARLGCREKEGGSIHLCAFAKSVACCIHTLFAPGFFR